MRLEHLLSGEVHLMIFRFVSFSCAVVLFMYTYIIEEEEAEPVAVQVDTDSPIAQLVRAPH